MAMSIDQITAKLSKHPELLNRVERCLEIIENADGRTTLADDAEERVIEELREFGRELLEKWAYDESQRQEGLLLNSGLAVKKKAKKNSTGIPPTEQ